MEVHMVLLHYCTFRLEAANDAQNVRVDTARRQDNNQQNLSKMLSQTCITKSLQMSEDTMFISS